jgi:excisionase family DNA binding protein
MGKRRGRNAAGLRQRGCMRSDPIGNNSVATSPDAAPRRRLTRADVMTAREVAELLDLPVSTVYEFARRGILPCARLGRAVRFVRAEIERTLEQGETTDERERGIIPPAPPAQPPARRRRRMPH